ncbi:MAG: cell division protein FtsZ, partial [Spirosomataceae bacterium]
MKVIGVGGAGSNAVNHMIESGFQDVGYVVCNTDQQALQKMDERAHKLQLGIELTKGLGAGTNPEVGRKAALESEDSIRQILTGKAEMVFITAGMGGGTGTGAAPEIARIAKELGLLVVAVVSDPFGFEGNTKILQALEGIEKLKEHADTVLVIKNQLLQDLYKDLPVRAAYKKADEVLANGVKSIAELITSQGEINCDFADVKMVLQNAGQAMMGSAVATGDKRAIEAITQALESPLLENNKIFGAKRILVSIAYSDEKPEYEIKMSDQTLITEFVQGEIQADAEVFKHGYSIDRSLKDGGLRVTIVAAGFGSEGNKNLRIQPKEEPAVI